MSYSPPAAFANGVIDPHNMAAVAAYTLSPRTGSLSSPSHPAAPSFALSPPHMSPVSSASGGLGGGGVLSPAGARGAVQLVYSVADGHGGLVEWRREHYLYREGRAVACSQAEYDAVPLDQRGSPAQQRQMEQQILLHQQQQQQQQPLLPLAGPAPPPSPWSPLNQTPPHSHPHARAAVAASPAAAAAAAAAATSSRSPASAVTGTGTGAGAGASVSAGDGASHPPGTTVVMTSAGLAVPVRTIVPTLSLSSPASSGVAGAGGSAYSPFAGPRVSPGAGASPAGAATTVARAGAGPFALPSSGSVAAAAAAAASALAPAPALTPGGFYLPPISPYRSALKVAPAAPAAAATAPTGAAATAAAKTAGAPASASAAGTVDTGGRSASTFAVLTEAFRSAFAMSPTSQAKEPAGAGAKPAAAATTAAGAALPASSSSSLLSQRTQRKRVQWSRLIVRLKAIPVTGRRSVRDDGSDSESESDADSDGDAGTGGGSGSGSDGAGADADARRRPVVVLKRAAAAAATQQLSASPIVGRPGSGGGATPAAALAADAGSGVVKTIRFGDNSDDDGDDVDENGSGNGVSQHQNKRARAAGTVSGGARSTARDPVSRALLGAGNMRADEVLLFEGVLSVDARTKAAAAAAASTAALAHTASAVAAAAAAPGAAAGSGLVTNAVLLSALKPVITTSKGAAAAAAAAAVAQQGALDFLYNSHTPAELLAAASPLRGHKVLVTKPGAAAAAAAAAAGGSTSTAGSPALAPRPATAPAATALSPSVGALHAVAGGPTRALPFYPFAVVPPAASAVSSSTPCSFSVATAAGAGAAADEDEEEDEDSDWTSLVDPREDFLFGFDPAAAARTRVPFRPAAEARSGGAQAARKRRQARLRLTWSSTPALGALVSRCVSLDALVPSGAGDRQELPRLPQLLQLAPAALALAGDDCDGAGEVFETMGMPTVEAVACFKWFHVARWIAILALTTKLRPWVTALRARVSAEVYDEHATASATELVELPVTTFPGLSGPLAARLERDLAIESIGELALSPWFNAAWDLFVAARTGGVPPGEGDLDAAGLVAWWTRSGGLDREQSFKAFTSTTGSSSPGSSPTAAAAGNSGFTQSKQQQQQAHGKQQHNSQGKQQQQQQQSQKFQPPQQQQQQVAKQSQPQKKQQQQQQQAKQQQQQQQPQKQQQHSQPQKQSQVRQPQQGQQKRPHSR